MRALFLSALAGLLVAGCGTVEKGPYMAKGQYQVYEATYVQNSQHLAVIDSDSLKTVRTLPIGAPSPDWKHLYSVASNTLLDSNPATGDTLHPLALARPYHLPLVTISGVPGGLSHNGRWLVLEAIDTAGNNPPKASHFLVVDTSYKSAPVAIDLTGWFAFDGVSDDGRFVYLLEYLSNSNYRVRMYIVGEHLLNPAVIVDKSEPQASMSGVRVASVSPDGQWQYTVYAREHNGAFIHALPLNGAPYAICIDLPGAGFATDAGAFRWSLAVNPRGTVLYAVNGAIGNVTEINIGGNSSPKITRSAHIDSTTTAAHTLIQDVEAKEMGGNAAVLSLDEKTLVTAGTAGVLWLDTADLHVRMRALEEWHVWSLGLSPDGKALYALSDAGMLGQLSMATGSLGVKGDPGAGYPMDIMRVAST
jgi:hypothetical protein